MKGIGRVTFEFGRLGRRELRIFGSIFVLQVGVQIVWKIHALLSRTGARIAAGLWLLS